jgi:hypothetical protein
MTPGAIRAGDGRYVFDMARVNRIDANPDYTTANGAVIEGERMLVGSCRCRAAPAGRPIPIPTSNGSM